MNPKTQIEDWHIGNSSKRDGFRTLAKKALDILEITQKYDLDNDPGLLALEQKKASVSDILPDYPVIKQLLENPSTLESIRNKAFGELHTVFDLPQMRFSLPRLFLAIYRAGKPWQEALYDNRRDSYILKVTLNYGIFHDQLFFDKKDKNAVFHRVTEFGDYINAYPWAVVCSTIAFDFLENGGQSRYILCDFCGRFTFVKRTGKKFCSDICRTLSRQKQEQLKNDPVPPLLPPNL